MAIATMNIWQEKEIAKIPCWLIEAEKEQSIELIKLGFTVEFAVNEHQALLNLENYSKTVIDVGDWKIGFDCNELEDDDFDDDDFDDPNFEGCIQAHLKGVILAYSVDLYPVDFEEAEDELSCFKYKYQQAIDSLNQVIAKQKHEAEKHQLCLI